MTRREYLTALEQYLVTMSVSEKTAIINEYDKHFRKGLEAGKTETQISASLGSPYDVANQILAGHRPSVPTYPARTQTQAASAPTYPTYQTQARPQTASAPTYPTYQAQARPQAASAPTYPTYQTQARPQTASVPTYQTQPHPQAASVPTYPTSQTQPHPQTASAPTYPTYPTQTQQQSYSTPTYPTQANTQYDSYSHSGQAYVDYDRAAADKDIHPEKQNRESKYNSTGIIIVIVLCIVLIPTLGSAIVGLLVGLYSLIVAFPTTGVALIAAGGALSAKSLWVCMGLILIGISFLALTGLIVMAAIEGTKLFVKLVRYIIKECKKMIKEGSF